MKILIVGCGSIGKRHIENLSKIAGIEILACRVRGKDHGFEKKFGAKGTVSTSGNFCQKQRLPSGRALSVLLQTPQACT